MLATAAVASERETIARWWVEGEGHEAKRGRRCCRLRGGAALLYCAPGQAAAAGQLQ